MVESETLHEVRHRRRLLRVVVVEHAQVQTELVTASLAALHDAGIDVPRPQRDVHIARRGKDVLTTHG
jgi:hypothetical protein